MTTTDLQLEQTDSAEAARDPIRAPEAAHVHGARPAMGQASAPAITAKASPQPSPDKPPAHGNWFHRNRWFTKESVTYTAYQFFRSTVAAIPYGFAMAAGHHAFNLFSVWGQKKGLTEEGIKTFTAAVKDKKNGVLAVEAAANAAKDIGEFYKPGMGAVMGRNLMRLGNSPMNAAVQIGMGFTLFRFTGGLIKNLRDRVMNEKNTPEQTNLETKDWWQTIKQAARINWPAESIGTPIAAIVLGFMNGTFTPPPGALQARDPSRTFRSQVREAWSPKAKLFQNGATWALSYSLFFLMAESLFKDVQIRRGLWKGHPNSLKNGPDDTVGGPGAALYHGPGSEEKIAAPLNESAEEGYKPADDHAKDSRDKIRFPFFTGEPSLGRFVFRRVLPVAVGITGYAAMKRAGYIAKVPGVEWTGPMQGLTVESYEAMKGVGDHLKLFGKNAWREGKATATFGVLWMATDAWGSWYDKFFHQLQKKENQVELNPHQQQKHAELLARVNEKEMGTGRAA